ncbi:unnamed protein product, partial [Mesorhabditis belari]|uniref:Uncharacterized protein n=1 Tax=Mesorhabditis belari TaxID=2138241 RepID=A0AAF3F6Y3_9BILA
MCCLPYCKENGLKNDEYNCCCCGKMKAKTATIVITIFETLWLSMCLVFALTSQANNAITITVISLMFIPIIPVILALFTMRSIFLLIHWILFAFECVMVVGMTGVVFGAAYDQWLPEIKGKYDLTVLASVAFYAQLINIRFGIPITTSRGNYLGVATLFCYWKLTNPKWAFYKYLKKINASNDEETPNTRDKAQTNV